MPDSEPLDEKSLQLSAVYEAMNQTYREAVVSRALSFRTQLSSEANSALNSAIQKSRIRVTGYRDAFRAPHTVLRDPVSQALYLSPELSGAVLRAWAESQQALHDKMVEHLKNAGMEAEYPDFQAGKFRRPWPPNHWHSQRDKFIHENAEDDFSEDDAALMLCYVTGRAPVADGEAELDKVAGPTAEYLDQFLDFLKALPSTALEWREVLPNFIESVSSLITEKEAELKWADDIDAVFQTVRTEFSELLAFFEQDTETWATARVSQKADFAVALRSAERLWSLLAEYQPIHDRAPSISEERERIRQRDELLPVILEAIQEIDGLMTQETGNPDGSPPTPPDLEFPAEGPAERTPEKSMPATPAHGHDSLPATSPQEGLSAAETSTTQISYEEHAGVNAAEFTALQSENHGLNEETNALRSENQNLRDEVEVLKQELYESQEMEDSWRLSFLTSQGSASGAGADTATEVDSVNTAVEMAKKQFPGVITFAPNSESSVGSNPFNRPEKVWQALQWLATTYYKSKMGELRITNFDQSIKEACGWWYKSDQGETTVSRYRKSYTAHAHGKTYRLEEHIGKGTNFDARYTIRIAFDWDDGLRKVIVGYIGRHQQTDAS